MEFICIFFEELAREIAQEARHIDRLFDDGQTSYALERSDVFFSDCNWTGWLISEP